jgi:hypothetical protein
LATGSSFDTCDLTLRHKQASRLYIGKPGQERSSKKLKVSDIDGKFIEPGLSLADFRFKLLKQATVMRLSRKIFVRIIS